MSNALLEKRMPTVIPPSIAPIARGFRRSGLAAASLAVALGALLLASPAQASPKCQDVVIAPLPPVVGPIEPIDPTLLCPRFYVDPVLGNDNNAGTLAAPFGTIQHAIDVAALVKPATVILLPGIYSPISVANPQPFPLIMVDDVSIQGTSVMNTVLDGLNGSTDLMWFYSPFGEPTKKFADTIVDGITLQNGYVAVRMVDEFQTVKVTFANCNITCNEIGVEYAAIDLGPDASPDDTDNNGFIEFRPRFVHCTIAHNNIGIYDHLYGAPSVGEGKPAIINCIVWPNVCSDLEGIDASDINTVAFATSDACGLSVASSTPTSVLAMGLYTESDIYVNTNARDYRQIPQSPTVDIGTTSLSVPNGTSAKAVSPCGVSIRDADGEEYGNVRLEGGVYDIGSDELGELLIAGYIPNTTRFGTDGLGTVYDVATTWVTPSINLGSPLGGLFVSGIGPTTGYLQWLPKAFPGARPDGTIRPTAYLNYGILWINQSTWVPPVNVPLAGPGVPFTTTLNLPAAATRLNFQVLPRNPATGQFAPLSNLQSYLLGP
jgi:Protein of unknown function (DUF1565)